MIEKAPMWNRERIVAALLSSAALAACAVALLLLVASHSSSEIAAESDTGVVAVENIDGTDLSRVILTEEAAERLGVQTIVIGESDSGSDGTENGTAVRTKIPYSAVLYDLNGGAYVYTSPEPLTFVRAPITIDRIDGETAILLDGPDTGTAVVTIGGAELFGAEFEFEE